MELPIGDGLKESKSRQIQGSKSYSYAPRNVWFRGRESRALERKDCKEEKTGSWGVETKKKWKLLLDFMMARGK